jgi:hypothetical protein
MPDAFLDSTVVIGLHFRHAEQRARCKAALPSDGKLVCSHYVVFEVAGFASAYYYQTHKEFDLSDRVFISGVTGFDSQKVEITALLREGKSYQYTTARGAHSTIPYADAIDDPRH